MDNCFKKEEISLLKYSKKKSKLEENEEIQTTLIIIHGK
jgi:hypothetical protein